MVKQCRQKNTNVNSKEVCGFRRGSKHFRMYVLGVTVVCVYGVCVCASVRVSSSVPWWLAANKCIQHLLGKRKGRKASKAAVWRKATGVCFSRCFVVGILSFVLFKKKFILLFAQASSCSQSMRLALRLGPIRYWTGRKTVFTLTLERLERKRARDSGEKEGGKESG